MSKRFGRNQKRKLKERIAIVEADHRRVIRDLSTRGDELAKVTTDLYRITSMIGGMLADAAVGNPIVKEQLPRCYYYQAQTILQDWYTFEHFVRKGPVPSRVFLITQNEGGRSYSYCMNREAILHTTERVIEDIVSELVMALKEDIEKSLIRP